MNINKRKLKIFISFSIISAILIISINTGDIQSTVVCIIGFGAGYIIRSSI